ncbi:MAG: TROVE domain-containing protein [Promethearchaeota archaeon]
MSRMFRVILLIPEQTTCSIKFVSKMEGTAMKTYTTFSTQKTPQNESVPGKNMIKNSAGGFVFKVDDWDRLDRFLILGSEGGTYYIKERILTRENAECVIRCINKDGIRTVERIVEISQSGRAPKNDPALFALAMCAGIGDLKTRKKALDHLPDVARIGTHLFHFATYVKQFRGWGRALSTAIKRWYQEKNMNDLAYQVVKYRQRDGWSHRDLLRLSHPKTDEDERNNIYKWIVDGEIVEPIHKLIEGYELAKTSEKPNPKLIYDYGLTREMLPTEWLNNIDVWAALLENMPITAMIRNLGKMTNIGLLRPMSKETEKVVNTINNQQILRKARVHPISILMALKTYENGRGIKGDLSWDPVIQIVDGLNDAFYLTFKSVESTGKRYLLGLDVSGSMAWGHVGGSFLTPREASGAMALVTAATETNYHIMGFGHEFVQLPISPRQRLDEVINKISNLPFGNTDCALPMLWAIENNVEIDCFIIYTDSETWYGEIHPYQALQKYRNKFGIPAKLIVVAMVSNGFTIADPNDGGMLDVVGFDTAVPEIIANFVRGFNEDK